jgi:hypothetical protein
MEPGDDRSGMQGRSRGPKFPSFKAGEGADVGLEDNRLGMEVFPLFENHTFPGITNFTLFPKNDLDRIFGIQPFQGNPFLGKELHLKGVDAEDLQGPGEKDTPLDQFSRDKGAGITVGRTDPDFIGIFRQGQLHSPGADGSNRRTGQDQFFSVSDEKTEETAVVEGLPVFLGTDPASEKGILAFGFRSQRPDQDFVEAGMAKDHAEFPFGKIEEVQTVDEGAAGYPFDIDESLLQFTPFQPADEFTQTPVAEVSASILRM